MTAITRLEVENFLRLRSVEIVPAGDVVEVAGRNAQGKTSLLRAIESTLGGKAHVPASAVREGAESGWTRVSLDNGMTVERTYTADGKTRLKVTGEDGQRITAAQGELDALLGALTFEPLRFRDAAPKEQRKTLAALVGLDLNAVEAERAAVYDARTVQGREVKRLQAVVESSPAPHPDLPSSPLDMGEALGVLNAARETVEAHQRERSALAADEARADEIEAQIAALTAERDTLLTRIDAQRDLVASLSDPDLADLERQVAELGGTNEKIRAQQERRRAEEALAAEAAEYDRLTAELARIDGDTQAAVAGSELPVPGLSLSDSGVLLNGRPFEQASAAETIRVCFAVAAAEKPGLSIALIRDGSLLDDESRDLILAEAAAAGCQLWLERVGRDSGGFVIEDGEVVSVPAAEVAGSVFGWEA